MTTISVDPPLKERKYKTDITISVRSGKGEIKVVHVVNGLPDEVIERIHYKPTPEQIEIQKRWGESLRKLGVKRVEPPQMFRQEILKTEPMEMPSGILNFLDFYFNSGSV